MGFLAPRRRSARVALQFFTMDINQSRMLDEPDLMDKKAHARAVPCGAVQCDVAQCSAIALTLDIALPHRQPT